MLTLLLKKSKTKISRRVAGSQIPPSYSSSSTNLKAEALLVAPLNRCSLQTIGLVNCRRPKKKKTYENTNLEVCQRKRDFKWHHSLDNYTVLLWE